jgi:hypothetical protein
MSEVQIPDQAYNAGLDVLARYPLGYDDRLGVVDEVLHAAAPAIVVAELCQLAKELRKAYVAAIEFDKQSTRADGISAAVLKIQHRIAELNLGRVKK